MKTSCLVLASAAFLAVAPSGAQPPADVDLERSAWRHRRTVGVSSSESFAALHVPPEVGAKSQPDLRDLRLVDAEGTEWPYFVDRVVPRDWRQSHAGRLVDRRSTPLGQAKERRSTSEWVADLGEVRTFDTLLLAIPGRDFAKHFLVEGSDDRADWDVLGQDVPMFEGPWAARVRHTTFCMAAPVEARYLRLSTTNDRRSPPVQVTGVSVSSTRRGEGEEWRMPVALLPEPSNGTSRYRLDLPDGFPFDTLTLEADDPAFSRQVSLYEEHESDGRPEQRRLGKAQLYRLSLPDEALAVDSRTLILSDAPERGGLILEIEGGDSPPLRHPRLEIAGAVRRLVFASRETDVTLFYGNEGTRAPVYDIARLQGRLRWSPGLAAATLGPENGNPRFQKATPFPFTPARGAALDVTRWKATRPLTIAGAEDVFTLTLPPEDLARLRPDLGDLRIAGSTDAQVPFILEARASEARLPLAVERTSGSGSGGRPGLSRHRLTAEDWQSGEKITLPLRSLELHFAEGFFERSVRLLEPAEIGRQGERVLHAGTLSRRPDERPRAEGERLPLVLEFSETRAGTLTLEIQDGDNAPLTLERAEAVVRVPRLVFKAAPGRYRLLLGNRDARPPSYDLAALRREVLAYSALPVEVGATAPNRAHRRSVSDYFRDAPSALVLWGTLIAGVLVLLGLVARILRQPPAGNDTPPGAGSAGDA